MPVTLLTDLAETKITAAAGSGTQVAISHIALGDGGGANYAPTHDQTALVNERAREAIETRELIAPNVWRAKAAFPKDTEAFDVREIGFFDVDGDLIAIWAGADIDPRRTGVIEYVVEHMLSFARVDEGIIVINAANGDPGALDDFLDGLREFQSAADFFADTTMTYADLSPGDIVRIRDEGFAYRVMPLGVTRPHVTVNGVLFACIPTTEGTITVRQVGGVEDSDITERLQHAIMVASYGDNAQPIAGGVFIDIMDGALSDVVVQCYGFDLTGQNVDFRSVRVWGLGRSYGQPNETHHMGTKLNCSQLDRPAFFIQGGRSCELGKMQLIGPAHEVLRTFDRNSDEIRTPEGWDAKLASVGITPGLEHAPHFAVVMDGMSGPEPDIPYPDFPLHPWFTPSANWDGFYEGIAPGRYRKYGMAGGSTQTYLYDMQISGWEGGDCQQPGQLNANCDFTRKDRLDVRNC